MLDFPIPRLAPKIQRKPFKVWIPRTSRGTTELSYNLDRIFTSKLFKLLHIKEKLLFTVSSLFLTITPTTFAENNSFTTLNFHTYQQTVHASQKKIQQIFATQKKSNYQNQTSDQQIQWLTAQLADTPYTWQGGIGEGDWQAKQTTYHPGALHVQQNPVYRLDEMDCQTFVQTIMALFYAHDLASFEKTYLKIAYGAAHHPNHEIVRYDNRNHFIAADFNPINQHNGFLSDITAQEDLAEYSQIRTVEINRKNWFMRQQQNPKQIVNVLHAKDGPAMVEKLQSHDWAFYQPHFAKTKIQIAYLPKEAFLIQHPTHTNIISNANTSADTENEALLWQNHALLHSQQPGQPIYLPNQSLLNKIATPAIAEIIINAKKNYPHQPPLSQLIGTDLTVSHLGLLYRQTFQRGQLIFQQINCNYSGLTHPICQVQSITCQKDHCDELMFAHATDTYPHGYYFYRQKNGRYICTAQHPPRSARYTQCNRVERLPLFAYLTTIQDGWYWHLANPVTLGIHLEKLQ